MAKKTTPLVEASRPLSTLELYHERQSRMFCGMHAINNLLQLPENERYDKHNMDLIADEMHQREIQVYADALGAKPNIKNNHKSKLLVFSMGNYSFEVLSEALQKKEYKMEIVDPNLQYEDWDVNSRSVVGLIVNVQNPPRTGICACFPLFSCSRDPDDEMFDSVLSDGHWFSIGKIYHSMPTEHEINEEQNDYGTETPYRWYNHDSKFKAPQVLSSNNELHRFIQLLKAKRQLHMWRVLKFSNQE